MKKAKSILVLVLAFAMILSVTACSKKPIDEDEFEEIMEDKFDFEVEDGATSKDIDEARYAYDEDNDYYANFTLYKDTDDAEDEVADYIDEIEEAKDDKDFEGKITKSGSGKYQKITVKGEHDDWGDMYVVIIRADNMVLMVGTDSVKDKRVDQINKIVKGLGY